MYVDIDVHHCDAVEDAFNMTDRVLTVSFHHHGALFFPGTGGLEAKGNCKQACVNIPLQEGCGDATFVALFSAVMLAAQDAFR